MNNSLFMSWLYQLKIVRIKWSKWEYWPFPIAILPVVFCYLYYSLKSFHFLFFKKVNPAVPMGGAFGVSKHLMLRDIEPAFLPDMVFAKAGTTVENLIELIKTNRITYPCILKPDIGERGFFVQKVLSESHLTRQYIVLPCDMIVQSFIDLNEEYTVSFHHFPGSPSTFAITSVCKKYFMQVTGDGTSTIRQLMNGIDRYLLQLARFEKDQPGLLDLILRKGEVKILESVGNHSRGTTFLDARHLISPQLLDTYKRICSKLHGLYFGRFDLKANSEQDFIQGRVKIMELNGVLGEPVHVYDPGYNFIKAYRDLFAQWKIIYRISKQAGSKANDTGFVEGIQALLMYRKYKKQMALSK